MQYVTSRVEKHTFYHAYTHTAYAFGLETTGAYRLPPARASFCTSLHYGSSTFITSYGSPCSRRSHLNGVCEGKYPYTLTPTFLNPLPVFSLPCQCYSCGDGGGRGGERWRVKSRGSSIQISWVLMTYNPYLNLLEDASRHSSMPWEFLGVRLVLFGRLTCSNSSTNRLHPLAWHIHFWVVSWWQ